MIEVWEIHEKSQKKGQVVQPNVALWGDYSYVHMPVERGEVADTADPGSTA